LQVPIGGVDEDTNEDLPPRAEDFAAAEGTNFAFAEVASRWARLAGSGLADTHVTVDEILQWLRQELDVANALREREDTSTIEQARAAGRAYALAEAALWVETCANRERLPWDPPRH